MKEQNDKIEKFFNEVDKLTFKAVKIMAVFIPLYVLYQLIFNS
jgi:phosphosulfolactate synthase (CoM biosynthesis protein A)